jgi:hypothetical protein
MSADRDPLEDLLASISDGRPPDWDAGARAAPSQRDRLESLREVSRIAEFHRGLQQGPADRPSPERWGDLLLLERIGAGARAEVHRAWDPALRREVALKLLHPGVDDAALLDEGRAAARIRHPHVVTVHGIDRRDGRIGLWMELVRGITLEQRVRAEGPLAPAEARRLGLELGEALVAVHAAGILHRDVKPANVVRDASGRHVLADFGLGGAEARARSDDAGPSGTPMYMAPELLEGAPASERSDVYALGMTLWFASTGRHPFEAGTLAELTAQAARGPSGEPLRARKDLSREWVLTLERAIAPDPARRFADARALLAAIGAASPDPRRRGPGRVIALTAFAVLVVLAGAFGLWRARHAPPAPAPTAAPAAAPASYSVEATFLRRERDQATRLVAGDRVRPGDRLSLELRTSRPGWVYVLDEDDRGERYLLFPQPLFDAKNPLPADSTRVLPGTVGGNEQAWTVTSAGGREYFLVVVSPEPLPELESELAHLPAPTPDRAVEYARVGPATVERLRGVGGLTELPQGSVAPTPRSPLFARFRALSGKETDVHGVWVRQIVLENP